MNKMGLMNTSLQCILKFHIPVGIGAAGMRNHGAVVSHVVVVQAETDPDPRAGGG